MSIVGEVSAAVVNNYICAVTVGITIVRTFFCMDNRSGVCGNNGSAVNSGSGDIHVRRTREADAHRLAVADDHELPGEIFAPFAETGKRQTDAGDPAVSFTDNFT